MIKVEEVRRTTITLKPEQVNEIIIAGVIVMFNEVPKNCPSVSVVVADDGAVTVTFEQAMEEQPTVSGDEPWVYEADRVHQLRARGSSLPLIDQGNGWYIPQAVLTTTEWERVAKASKELASIYDQDEEDYYVLKIDECPIDHRHMWPVLFRSARDASLINSPHRFERLYKGNILRTEHLAWTEG